MDKSHGKKHIIYYHPDKVEVALFTMTFGESAALIKNKFTVDAKWSNENLLEDVRQATVIVVHENMTPFDAITTKRLINKLYRGKSVILIQETANPYQALKVFAASLPAEETADLRGAEKLLAYLNRLMGVTQARETSHSLEISLEAD